MTAAGEKKALDANRAPRDVKVEPEDCLNCRLIGSATMGGLALYWNHLRLTTPKNAKVNRIFLGTMAAGNCAESEFVYCYLNTTFLCFTGFAGLSVFRLFY